MPHVRGWRACDGRGMNARALAGSVALAFLAACSAACSSTSAGGDAGKDASSGGDAGPAGGPATGPKDAHCTDPDGGAKTVIAVDPAACMPEASPDAGMTMGDGGVEPMPETMYGDEGDDDDCKYHVKWSVSNARNGGDATFTVTLTALATGKPVSNAAIDPETFLDVTHPAPPSDLKTTETSPGTYTMGPVKFDASGKWTTRFHFFTSCEDSPESPHGHASFFVTVP